jgi:hypothetical protein
VIFKIKTEIKLFSYTYKIGSEGRGCWEDQTFAQLKWYNFETYGVWPPVRWCMLPSASLCNGRGSHRTIHKNLGVTSVLKQFSLQRLSTVSICCPPPSTIAHNTVCSFACQHSVSLLKLTLSKLFSCIATSWRQVRASGGWPRRRQSTGLAPIRRSYASLKDIVHVERM